MNVMNHLCLGLVVAAVGALVASDAWAQPLQLPAAAPRRITASDPRDVRDRAIDWLKQQKADPAAVARAEEIWKDPLARSIGPSTGDSILERLASTLALGDPRAAQLVEQCRQRHAVGKLPDTSWLASDDVPPFVRANLQLYYGRWLSRERLYDEALIALAELQPGDVVDPASLLFFQAVAQHRLLETEAGLKTLGQLIDEVADAPTRYLAVAELMRADLGQLDAESLDHISRRMQDIERHLDLGRAGEKVVKLEDGVIDSLDKIIEEMEEQRRKQQGGGSGGGSRPTSPMPDSRLARAQGAGEVDRKPLGTSAGWGDLPAKQREEALQQIGKDFPAHYREVIEQYFRRLASEGSER